METEFVESLIQINFKEGLDLSKERIKMIVSGSNHTMLLTKVDSSNKSRLVSFGHELGLCLKRDKI